MSPVIVIPLVMIAAGALGVFVWLRRTRTTVKTATSDRRISLWAFCEIHRLTFDDPQANALLGMLGFRLLRSIDLGEAQLPTHGADNSISGTWEGTRVIVADWWTQETGAEVKPGPIGVAVGAPRLVAEYRTVAWLEAGTFPHLIVRRSGMLREGAEKLLGSRVDFELEAFNRAFAVEADDREVAYAIIDARMIAWLLDPATMAFDVELGPGGVLVRATRLLTPEEIESFLNTAGAFIARIPDHARKRFQG